MLLSTVIPLRALNAPQNTIFLGRESHGWFLRLVEAADLALSQRLHSARSPKPYTVSAPRPWGRQQVPWTEITQGERYYLRVTALDEELSGLLLEKVLPHLPETMRLREAVFEVDPPLSDGNGHPWARRATAEELVDRWFGSGRGLGRTLELLFSSPTVTRRIRRNVLLPLPSVIFTSYLRSWNRYCHPRFDEDLIDLVEAEVAISRYDLRTTVVDHGDYRNAGYVGRCAYNIFHEEQALRRVVHLLADYSLYCGTGYKTTQGMGQTMKAG